jgi:hypothetical protein
MSKRLEPQVHEPLAKAIREFQELVHLNITSDYLIKRGFDEIKSIKELIQNALDENEDVHGRPFVDLRREPDGLVIQDKGRGFKPEYLLIGSSNKKCWMRGYYGEGLKLAASYFTFHGFPVYIFSLDKVFKFVINDRAVAVFVGEAVERTQGTKILLYNYKNPDISLNKLTSIYDEELKGELIDTVLLPSKDCEAERPARIYGYPDKLFIRNIFVGNNSEIAKRKSFFSYDIWWVRLDVSRTLQSYSMPDVFREVARIYEKSDKARRLLAKKLIESGMAKRKEVDGKPYLTFSPIFAIFEGHLFVYNFPRGVLSDIVDEFGIEKETVKLVIGAAPEEIIKELLNKGTVPFVIATELAETGEFQVALRS